MTIALLKCSHCHIDKPVNRFYINKNTKTGYTSWCRPCTKLYYRERRNNIRHLPEFKRATRNARLKNIYGISQFDYENLLNKQEYICAICKTDLCSLSKNEIHIDHNHKTGKVRGILCRHCNRGLGGFKDNLVFVKNAATYLESYDNSKS